MPINSRQKGKRGELEVARILRKFGYDARRSQQYAGINSDADVVGLPGVHLEVKRVETLNISKAMEQSKRDAADGEIPTVVHRKNGEEWLITMRFEDWLEERDEWIHKDSPVAP
jgi:Holliday junction resolvase